MPPSDELSRILRRGQRERRLPSASAAVFEDGDVTWTEAVGLADVGSGASATPDTQYRIGSITKVFTTLAVLQLREEGKVDLDDPLERHLPDTPLGALRLRGMLSHTSGLQRERPGIDWENPRPLSPEALLGALPEAERVLAPGQAWHYSNLAFDLLGELVVRVSGLPYRDFVDTRIIRPLGLARTTWEPTTPVAKGYFVRPYTEAVEEQRPDDIGLGASGQLWSTASDVARLGAFLCAPDRDVLAPATVADMHVVHGMADTATWTVGYGLGLQLFRRGERVFAGHTGGMPGFVSILCYARRERVGAVVLTSSGAPTGEPTGLLLAEKALEHRATPEWRPADAPAALDELVGPWWSEGYEFVFFVRDGKLQARLADQPETVEAAVFEPDGDDRYRAVWGRERGEPLVVERDDAGAVRRMLWATYPFTREPSAF